MRDARWNVLKRLTLSELARGCQDEFKILCGFVNLIRAISWIHLFAQKDLLKYTGTREFEIQK